MVEKTGAYNVTKCQMHTEQKWEPCAFLNGLSVTAGAAYF